MTPPVESREHLSTAIDRATGGRATPATSLFATPDRLASWIEQGLLSLHEDENGLLLFRRDRDFAHVYHVAPTLEHLDRLLAGRPALDRALVADLVGRPEAAQLTADTYRKYGFEDHSSLTRMSRVGTPEGLSEPGAAFARPDDAEGISAFLDRLLDPYVDQIPDVNEVREGASRRNILVTQQKDEVTGVLWFETTGLTSHLRYWYVGRSFVGAGIGSRLIRGFFQACASSRRLILWVVSDNVESIAKYEHYGFRAEPLVDRIMLLPREQHLCEP